MKKLILLMILIPVFAFAFNENEESIACDFEVVTLSKDDRGTTFSVNFVQPELVEDENSLNQRYTFSPGCGVLSQPGHPIVPFISRYVRLQPTGNAHIEIINSHYTSRIIPDYVVAEGSSLDDLDENLTEDGFFPTDIVDIGEPGILREFRVTPVKMCPVQVNQETGEVRTYDHIIYRVIFDDDESENELENYPTKISQTFLPVYQQFLDWQLDELDDYELYQGGIQILAPNGAVRDTLAKWVTWKKQLGYDVEFVPYSSSASTMRNTLISRWNNREEKFDYVVIVGDSDGEIEVNNFYEYYSGRDESYEEYTDFHYHSLAGNDNLPEVMVGRISVRNLGQLENYIQKTFKYEKYPIIDDSNWFNRVSSNYYSITYPAFSRGGYNIEETYWNSNGLANEINEGFNIGVGGLYIEYCDIDEQISQFSNNEKHPFIMFLNGDAMPWTWYSNSSTSEFLLNAENENGPTGAIAVLTSHTNSDEIPENWTNVSYESAAYCYSHCNSSIGLSNFNILVQLKTDDISAHEWALYEFYIFRLSLLGDPSIKVWHTSPELLTVGLPESLVLGSNLIPVSVEKNGLPLEDAVVTLLKIDNGQERIVKGKTGPDGTCELYYEALETGEATITVSCDGCKPEISILSVENSQSVSIYEFVVYDDGRGESIGNDNMSVDYGETVALDGYLENISSSTLYDLVVTVEDYGTCIDTAWGEVLVDSMQSGNGNFFGDYIYVKISKDAPDAFHEYIKLLCVDSEDDTSRCVLDLIIHSPDYCFEGDLVDLEPGISSSISLLISNNGSADGGASEVHLVSNDDWLIVDSGSGTLGPILAENTSETSEFQITIDSDAFDGYEVRGELVIIEGDTVDIIPLDLAIGTRTEFSPSGPDYYGHYAFDNVDDHIMSPTYYWEEINPDSENHIYEGVHLNVDESPDYIEIPFSIRFYGEVYSGLTISEHGWIGVGDQRDIRCDDDYNIPSPLGPYGMIAPHLVNYNHSQVYYFIDMDGQRCIIQWCTPSNESRPSFQTILYPAGTGELDSDILFQYKKNPNYYYTVGIEDQSQNQGLKLKYKRDFSEGVAPFANKSSILISQKIDSPRGTVSGIISQSLDNSPLEGVIVESLNGGFRDTTDAEGYYCIEVKTGTNILMGRKEGYPNGISNEFEVHSGGSTTQNLTMPVAVPETDPEYLYFYLNGDQSAGNSFNILNHGDGDLNINVWSTLIHPDRHQMGEPGEHAFRLDLTAGDVCYQMGDSILVYNDQNGQMNELYIYDRSGDLINNFGFDAPGGITFRRMKVVGEELVFLADSSSSLYLYEFTGSGLSSTRIMDIPIEIDDQFSEIAVDNTCHELYIFARNLMFTMDLTTESIIDTTDLGIDDCHDENSDSGIYYKGADIITEDSDSMSVYLLVYNYYYDYWGDYRSTSYIRKLNKNEGEMTNVFTISEDYHYRQFFIYKENNNSVFYAGFYDNYDYDYGIFVKDLFSRNQSIGLGPHENLVTPGGQQSVSVGVHGVALDYGVTKGWIVIDNDSPNNRLIIPMDMQKGVSGIEITDVAVPDTWEISNIYPNPFNPTTNVEFALVENADVKVKLYNIMGQEVALVLDQKMNAGYHRVTVDGTLLASGVYFLEFEAGPIRDVRKIVLLK